jgi:hypothetical protein
MVLMFSPASSSKVRRKSDSWSAPRDRIVIAFAIAIAVLPWIVWDDEQQNVTPIVTELRTDSDFVVLTVIDAEPPSDAREASVSFGDDDVESRSQLSASCPIKAGKFDLSLLELTQQALNPAPLLTIPQRGQEMLDTMGAALASIGSLDLVAYARRKIVPDFSAAYGDIVKRVALMALTRLQEEAAFAHATIVGTVSTYNPFRAGKEEGGRPHPAKPTTPKLGLQQ